MYHFQTKQKMGMFVYLSSNMGSCLLFELEQKRLMVFRSLGCFFGEQSGKFGCKANQSETLGHIRDMIQGDVH